MEVKEHTQKLNDLIREYIQIVIDIAPQGWQKIVSGFLLFPDESPDKLQPHYSVFYLLPNGQYVAYTRTKNSVYSERYEYMTSLLQNIYEECASVGDNWDSLTCTVQKDGSFSLEFSYDNCEYSADTKEIMKVLNKWESEHLI